MIASISQGDVHAGRENSKRRLLSLDAFRGAVIIAMILANAPGDGYVRYGMLTHAVWNGWTFVDLIAPAFLWIIGLAMVFSFQRRMEEGTNLSRLSLHIFRRSLIIFLIGIVLNLCEIYQSPDKWSIIKYMGVLQRIGISYLFTAMLFIIAGIRGHVVWVIAGPLIYTLLILFVPVPGAGTGVLEPVGNAASYIDDLILGQHGGLPHTLLSLFDSTTTMSFGVLVGYLLKIETSLQKKTFWLLASGAGLILLSELTNQWMPINRRLWTPSFVFLTAGISTITFCALYWLVEIAGYRKWTKPLVVFGLNPIIIIFFSELIRLLASKKGVVMEDGSWLSLWDYAYRMLFMRIADPANASLLFSMTCVLIFYVFSRVLYSRGWVIKI